MEFEKIDEKMKSLLEFPWFLAVYILCRSVWISVRNKSNSSFSMIIDFNLNQVRLYIASLQISIMGYRVSLKTRRFPVQISLMCRAGIREATS